MNHVDSVQTAKQILADVMAFRRVPKDHEICANEECADCAAMHLPKVLAAVRNREPVPFVLPAFPGKSPNPEKVLGHLPDFAERLALQFLGTLAARIRAYYEPGVKIRICSDGRVFSDVVGMDEGHVTSYQVELDRLITEMALADIVTFNLDDVFADMCFDQMRHEMMKRFGQSSDFLRQKVRNGAQGGGTREEQEANRMYCGMTRFLFEDALHPGQSKSRNAIQKDVRARAYEVMRRSNAWTELIAERFPDAVRLSIHPQVCGSRKLGIRLVGDDSWMTPWHGVAVETAEGFLLMKHAEARVLGAELVLGEGKRPSHFVLGGLPGSLVMRREPSRAQIGV
jgi:pyoverdine/dityrosine biosynthesis protein Dit1